jgi:class 3 adenylate cyclase/tetratricopeptide (TPR) repeat protein
MDGGQLIDLAAWLTERGLGKYASLFIENDVDFEVFKALSEDDLRELGLSLGARKRILEAITEANKPLSSSQRQVDSTPQLGPERRQITVLFSDIVGSTTLAEQMDVEDLRSLLLAYQQACATVIADYDGHIAQYLGDGVLAYFGYPHAHEDDAVRAVRVGLAMIERMQDANRRLAADHGVSLDIRVGIHTGLVVAGEMGAGATREQLAVGETPNVAARIQSLADRQTVVVSDATWRLVDGFFTAQPLGSQALKGVSRPISTYRILGSTGLVNPFEARLARSLTPLISREVELSFLAKRWEQTRDGEGQVVVLQGEAGIGKSRLVRAFRDRLADLDHVIVVFQCASQYQSSVLAPVIEYFSRTLQFERADSIPERQPRLRALIERLELGPDAFPPLALLLGILDNEDSTSLPSNPDQRRRMTFDVLVRTIVAAARQRPVLVVIEDAHWIDPSTHDLIGNIVDAIQNVHVMVLLTARPEYRAPWTALAHAATLTIGRLTRRETETMIRQVAGDTLTNDLLMQLLSRSEGVPLFVEELTKSVMESTPSNTGRAHTVPETLQDALTARLDRMAPVRELIQVAALLGRVFDVDIVREVTGLTPDRLNRALADLSDAGLIYRRARRDGQAFEFKHALIQDAALNTLVRPVRARLHGRIADVLSRTRPDIVQQQPEVLAHHLQEAGDDRAALNLWRAAGELAAQRSASAEAADHFRQAVACLQRLGSHAVPAQEQTALHLALATALMQSEGYQAAGLATAVEDAERAAAGGESVPLRCHVVLQMVAVLCGAGRHRTFVVAVDRLLREASRELTPSLRGSLLVARSIGQYHLGDFLVAERGFAEALDVLSNAADSMIDRLGGADPVVAGAAYASLTLHVLGRLDTALRSVLAAEARARVLNHPFSLVWALFSRSRAYGALGQYERARADAEEALELSRKHGFTAFVARSLEFRGRARAGLGDLPRAIEDCRDALTLWSKSGVVQSTPYIAAGLAEFLVRAGQSDQAREVLDRVDAVVAGTDEAAVLAECQRVRGLIALDDGDLSGALHWLETAIGTSRRQAARLYELRATTALAEVLVRHDRRTDAYRFLADVYGWFTEGHRAPDLQSAEGVLDHLKN